MGHKPFNSPKFVMMRFFLSLILLMSGIYALAQERGSFSFASPPAQFIQQRPDISNKNIQSDNEKSRSPFSQKFVGAVGGVSFQNVANPDSALLITSVNLQYNPLNTDGKRVELQINGARVNFQLFDWQAIPIAKFADSEFTSCFTYFGKLKNEQLEKIILENKGHVLNYHPAFSNTLVGWRLADMDMLILYDFTTDLPKSNNKYLLGAGETKPNLEANQRGAYRFHNHINTVQNTFGYRFQSYVISDFPRQTDFTVNKDSLVISGYPYYYCWYYQYQEPGFDVNAVADSLSVHFMSIINSGKSSDPGFNIHEFLIDSLIATSIEYEKNFDMYKAGTFSELLTKKTMEEKRDFLRKYAPESVANILIQVRAEMISHSPVYLKAFSDEISAFPELINDYNPAVWNTAVNTMRFSAFFRYIKINYPNEWKKFCQQVADVKISPAVTTPTIIYETGNTSIEKELKKYSN